MSTIPAPNELTEDDRLAAEFDRISAQTAAALEFRLAQVSVVTASVALLTLVIARAQGNVVLPTAWYITFLFIGFYGLTWTLVRVRRYRPWMRWVAATFDTLLVSVLYASDAILGSGSQALLGSGPVLYLFAIVAAMLRTEPRVALYSGVSGSLQFALVSYLWVYPALTPEQRLLPEFAPWLAWQKAAFILGGGFLARAAGRRVRRLHTRITWDAIERESLRGRFGEHVVEGLLEAAPASAPTPPVPTTSSGTTTLPGPSSSGGTTLFVAGLSGFAKVASGQRPEELAALRSRFVELVVSVAEQEGGRVDRFLSDGALAVFEGPDDAARALRASQVLTQQVRAELGARQHVEIGLDRVTAETGEQARTPAERMSEALNTASRLRDECPRRKRHVLFTRALRPTATANDGVEELGWSEVAGLQELLPLFALKEG